MNYRAVANLTFGQQSRRRVINRPHASVGHLENAGLISRTVAILNTAQYLKAAVSISFQLENNVYHVLQNFRTGDRAFFSNVSDQNQTGLSALGGGAEQLGAIS